MAPERISGRLIARSGTVADPRWSPDGSRIAWIAGAGGGGEPQLFVSPCDGSRPPVVVSAEDGVAGGYCWAGSDELVVGAADGRLVAVAADGGTRRVLTHDGRALTPAVSARDEVACSVERDDACDVVVVPLDGSGTAEPVSKADYAWDPAWSADGRALAWHEWTLPDMPWDASRIVVRGTDGARVVADAPACGQPRFAPTGEKLAFVREAMLCVDGEPVLDEAFEHAEPSWSPGQRSFAWSPDGSELAWCRNEHGFGRLVVGTPGRKSARELSKGWHRGIDWGPRGIACVRSGAVTPPSVVVLAANGSARHAIARGAAGGFERTSLVEPRAVSWRSRGATVHGLLWRADGAAPRRGLVVHVHGGPTGQAIADWTPRVQWLVQRGFAVLQPNFRGSTGYGTPYRQALDREWGDRDVADVVAALRHAVKEGWCDAGRVVLMGGSAGGLTVLLAAAAEGSAVAGVIALYPVTDLLHLAATTHRFESGAHLRLVGPLPEARETYVARSPVTHAARVRAPVLLLHGAADRDVLPRQSEMMEVALRAAGTPVERHVYDGEGHGWRRAETVEDELRRIEEFLAWRLP